MRSTRWFKAQSFLLPLYAKTVVEGLTPGPVGSKKILGQSGIKSLASSCMCQRITVTRLLQKLQDH
jgi:hypothetical protein